MNIMKEIMLLPNFAYIFQGNDGALHIAILGGVECKAVEQSEYNDRKGFIQRIHEKMEKLYSKGVLDVDEKKELANLMIRMRDMCDSRLIGNYSEEEQAAYVSSLEENEKEQIRQQLKMYKDSRGYYRDYIYH